ncbi:MULTISPECIES: DUF6625 family protein [unclassified Mucilaginibacter]|uniref:DUF6625 family protein n=1 Tax=unclassified Mucilaginibacter TaxID=2617802 RepID=UPI002AC8EF02|nr:MULTISPECIES: DUF6625 family protein [unclassified Mucilaginibacter]MEB0280868.1 hypothetical protein [Mucilaginibacter sp. 10B2]MEB0302751.1 hypothetical protein [Mucilaginibacter sp. 5C4]WPX25649.1 hypothetical protein RHM67_10270 [Mucilaginibacter sp. 5C4]
MTEDLHNSLNGKEPTIAIISCYFGELPPYFHLFIHSCKYNPSIDFFIVTDQLLLDKDLPVNIKIIPIQFQDMASYVSVRLGLMACIAFPYKMCDFKPAYGLIFQNYVCNYDFWAHGDIDVIYGNIRGFMTTELLNDHDIISVRPDWLPGCFVLFRNNVQMNNLYKNSTDYKRVFSSEKHFCFDETNFAHDEFSAGKPYNECVTEIDSMTHVVARLSATKQIRAFFDLYIIEGLPGQLTWKKGVLTFKSQFEIMLYHMIHFKNVYDFSLLGQTLPDRFRITRSVILKY